MAKRKRSKYKPIASGTIKYVVIPEVADVDLTAPIVKTLERIVGTMFGRVLETIADSEADLIKSFEATRK